MTRTPDQVRLARIAERLMRTASWPVVAPRACWQVLRRRDTVEVGRGRRPGTNGACHRQPAARPELPAVSRARPIPLATSRTHLAAPLALALLAGACDRPAGGPAEAVGGRGTAARFDVEIAPRLEGHCSHAEMASVRARVFDTARTPDAAGSDATGSQAAAVSPGCARRFEQAMAAP